MERKGGKNTNIYSPTAFGGGYAASLSYPRHIAVSFQIWRWLPLAVASLKRRGHFVLKNKKNFK